MGARVLDPAVWEDNSQERRPPCCLPLSRQRRWGCNDESALSIAAALHAALAAPATRYLDLDGSLDLAADPFTGGFALHGDLMSTLALPGLGVSPT